MTEAFKCDGCGKFFTSVPTYTLDAHLRTYQDEYPKHFHSLQCISKWVLKEGRQ